MSGGRHHTIATYVRLLVCEVSDPRERFDASEHRQLRDGSSVLGNVRLQGICTLLTRSAQSCELQIGANDGPGTSVSC